MEITNEMDVRIGCYGVVVQGGRVLLAHWNESGRSGWTLPGGGMEGTESVEETCVREVFEETGLEVRLTGLAGVHAHYVPPERRIDPGVGRTLRALQVVHTAEVVGGSLRDEVDGTTDQARWFDLDDLPTDRVTLVGTGLRLAGLLG